MIKLIGSLQVLWPMAGRDEIVVRMVPNRVRIMHSRDRVPFLVYFETIQTNSDLMSLVGLQGSGNQHMVEATVPSEIDDSTWCQVHKQETFSSALSERSLSKQKVTSPYRPAVTCSATKHMHLPREAPTSSCSSDVILQDCSVILGNESERTSFEKNARGKQSPLRNRFNAVVMTSALLK
jgi:hypothetical protein